MNIQKMLQASVIAGLCVLGCLPTISAAASDDETSHWNADRGVQLSMMLDFGARNRSNNGLSLTLGYGQPQLSRAYAPAPFMQARFADGQWRSLLISGVDVMTLNQRLNADGESSSWTPWIIGGLVGAGAVAIVVRYATNKSTGQTDLGQPVNPQR